MDETASETCKKRTLSNRSKSIIRVLLVIAILLALDNLHISIMTYIGNWKEGYLGSVVDPWDFWMVYPLLSGALGCVLGIILTTLSFSRKHPVGLVWRRVSLLFLLFAVLWWHRVFGFALFIFIYFVLPIFGVRFPAF